MNVLEAKVKAGRLVLDTPTELPDGETVELVPLDEVLAAGGDDLDEGGRKLLHESLARGLEDVRAGRVVSNSHVIAALRTRSGRR